MYGYYTYYQTNSGGRFTSGMPYTLHVVAESPNQADAIAEGHGVYFDGCEKGVDCDCCGDRWSRASGVTENPIPLGEATLRLNAPVWVVDLSGQVTRFEFPADEWGWLVGQFRP